MSTKNSDAERGHQDALQAWSNGTASRLTYGDIYSDIPVIDETTGLLLAVCWESEEYIRSYNQTLRRKLREEGAQKWVPGPRILSPERLLKLYQVGQSVTHLQLISPLHTKLLRRHTSYLEDVAGIAPERGALDDDAQMMVLFGWSDGRIRADQLDLISCEWVATTYFDPEV